MLSKEQIDRLFDFCEKHHVHHYDVQVELVDHLANAIEEKMANNNKLSFETALTSVHAGFGVLGFAGIVNARYGTLSKQCRKLKKEYFFSYFSWPKAAITLCLFLVLMLPLRFFTGNQLSSFTQLIIFIVFVFELFVLTENGQRIKKQKNKLLITQVFHIESWLTNFLLMQFSVTTLDIYNNKNHTIAVIAYGLMMLITILLFMSILSYRNVNQEADILARRQYPEAFVAE